MLQDELLRIWEKTGKTVLFVTHSIEEAAFLAQRVAVITARPGRIKAVGDIPLPSSRYERRDLRSTPEFAGIRHRLWERLSDEVVKARQGQSPNGVQTEVCEALSRTSTGTDRDWENVIRQVLRCGLAFAWSSVIGSAIATDCQCSRGARR